MRLTVVGAGPAYSDRPGDVGACYLVEGPAGAVVLDLGHGAFAGLASRIAPESLATVFISHLHPDHFVDLVALRHWLRYRARPAARVHVDGPAQLESRLDALAGEMGFAGAALDFAALQPGVRVAGPFTLEVCRVRHTDDSYAVRVSVDGVPGLVYSGDIGDASDLGPLVRPGDVLLVEASFGPGPVADGAQHLDGPSVGRLAASTSPGRVLLTHLLPDVSAADTVLGVHAQFSGSVEVVGPGTVVAW